MTSASIVRPLFLMGWVRELPLLSDFLLWVGRVALLILPGKLKDYWASSVSPNHYILIFVFSIAEI